MTSSDNLPHSLASIDDWNRKISTRLLPDSIILILYLVVGVLGNSVVLYIYIFRFKENKEDRFFIPALAVVDLVTCIAGTSMSISVNMLPVKYYNDAACKISSFLLMIFTMASMCLLLVISFHRYMKICKPFSKQVTLYWKKVTLILISVLSVLISWPCLLFYGSREIINDNTNATGYRCTSIQGPGTSTEPLIFKSVVFVVSVSILLSLITFYILIAKTVSKHMNNQRSMCTKPASSCLPQKVTQNTSSIIGTSDNPSLPGQTCSSTEAYAKATNVRCSQQGAGHRAEVRLTLIFMVITFIFVVGFVPKAILMITESLNEKFWIELNDEEMGGYRFLYTLFYVNNIVNPIIYSFFDKTFREKLKESFRTCTGKQK